MVNTSGLKLLSKAYVISFGFCIVAFNFMNILFGSSGLLFRFIILLFVSTNGLVFGF